MRLFLEYKDTAVELPVGQHLLGRDLDCRIRFNDSSVSRHHLRVVVGELGATVEDMNTTNGSTINGRPMVGAQPLQDGDEVQMGDRTLKVLIVGDAELPTDRAAVPLLEELPAAKPDTTQRVEEPPIVARNPIEHAAKQRCPDCGGPVAWEADACPSCGYIYSSGRPGAQTSTRGRPIPPRFEEKRRSARIPIDVPVIYSSPNVEFESTATDLSRGGMFIETEIAEQVGTTCHLTLLVDGGPAVQVQAVVCRVESKGGPRVSGIGVHFGSMSPEAHAWLVALLREARRS
jgi:uncharacterized protein (TIGR02266 family)